MSATHDNIITGANIIDGGTELNQNDLKAYISILIEQRNDANDLTSIYRTKCVSYVTAIKALQEESQSIQADLISANTRYDNAKRELDELRLSMSTQPTKTIEGSVNEFTPASVPDEHN